MPAAKPLTPAEANCRKTACDACRAQPGEPCAALNGAARSIVHFSRREKAVREGHHAP
jgi:hypothetical protein